jgi:hypothetical protein
MVHYPRFLPAIRSEQGFGKRFLTAIVLALLILSSGIYLNPLIVWLADSMQSLIVH